MPRVLNLATSPIAADTHSAPAPQLAPLPGLASPNSTTAPPMPDPDPILEQEFADLVKWRKTLASRAQRDYLAYLMTKLLVFSGSLGPMLLEHHNLGTHIPLLSGICTIAIAMDTIRPVGTLYKTHKLAASEIQMLLDQSRALWQTACLQYPSNPGNPSTERTAVAIQILLKIALRREQITQAVSLAESTLSDDKNGKPVPAPGHAVPIK